LALDDTFLKLVLIRLLELPYQNGHCQKAEDQLLNLKSLINIKLMILDQALENKQFQKIKHLVIATLEQQEEVLSLKWDHSKIHSLER